MNFNDHFDERMGNRADSVVEDLVDINLYEAFNQNKNEVIKEALYNTITLDSRPLVQTIDANSLQCGLYDSVLFLMHNKDRLENEHEFKKIYSILGQCSIISTPDGAQFGYENSENDIIQMITEISNAIIEYNDIDNHSAFDDPIMEVPTNVQNFAQSIKMLKESELYDHTHNDEEGKQILDDEEEKIDTSTNRESAYSRLSMNNKVTVNRQVETVINKLLEGDVGEDDPSGILKDAFLLESFKERLDIKVKELGIKPKDFMR